MYKTHIYIAQSTTSPRKCVRGWAYVITAEGRKGTRKGLGKIEGTRHRATLDAAIDALARFTDNTECHLHTEDVWTLNMIDNYLQNWQTRDFKNPKGEPITDADLWREYWRRAKWQKIVTEPGPHMYSEELKLAAVVAKEN